MRSRLRAANKFRMFFYCKHATTFRSCAFDKSDSVSKIMFYLLDKINFQNSLMGKIAKKLQDEFFGFAQLLV